MKTKNGFTLFENVNEIGPWLNKQSVTRTVNKLQVHHMGAPSYSTWDKTDKKVFSDPHFGRTESLDSYGKTTWNSKSANGKYIAQHFNVFPDGKITTGRSLNSNPIGISGWNTGAICVEIYGNFDKGQDTMNAAQKKAVIALFGELCKRFKLTPSNSTIRYHAWFTSGGTYLGDYKAGKSRKSCPGTNFFGGNTMAAFNKNFLPAVKEYIKSNKVNVSEPEQPKKEEKKTNKVSSAADALKNLGGNFKKYIVKSTPNSLNGRKGAGMNYDVIQKLEKGTAVTIVAEKMNGDTKWLQTASGYWISAAYTEFVKYV